MRKSQSKPDNKKDLKMKRRSPPKCRNCLNHGLSISVKGHKPYCDYKDCQCNLCLNTKEERCQTAARIAIYRESKRLFESDGMLHNNLYFLV